MQCRCSVDDLLSYLLVREFVVAIDVTVVQP